MTSVMSEREYFFDPPTYDAVYGRIDVDVAPLLACMRAAGGRVLEVCCGNGRLLLPAVEAGVACDGLDVDRRMLDDLRAKLAARGLDASLVEADMRDFDLPRRYALIVIAFNSFLHNLTQEDQLATLRTCLGHLEPGGRLVNVVFHPSALKLIELAGAERLSLDLPRDGGRLRVFDRAEDDRVEQTRRILRRLEYVNADGSIAEERRFAFRLRYVFKPEMELLLRLAGFARWEVRPIAAGYRDAAAAGEDRAPEEGDILLWTAWKA